MVELKFRAWDKKTQKIFPVKLIYFHHDVVWLPGVEDGCAYTLYRKFDEVEIMKSTGLKDKNETEIFEGDIVVFRVPNQAISGVYQIKQARSGEWRMDNSIQGRVLAFNLDVVKVIGNIYENPELMEGV